MSLAGCQIIPIYLNFHLQKCLEIFDKNLADKIQSKNYKVRLLGVRITLAFAEFSFRLTFHCQVPGQEYQMRLDPRLLVFHKNLLTWTVGI